MPYSIAKGLDRAWLHDGCKRFARDEGWRREFIRKAKAQDVPGMPGEVPAAAGSASSSMQRPVRGGVEPATEGADAEAVGAGGET